jgi:hypothetical protein
VVRFGEPHVFQNLHIECVDGEEDLLLEGFPY